MSDSVVVILRPQAQEFEYFPLSERLKFNPRFFRENLWSKWELISRRLLSVGKA